MKKQYGLAYPRRPLFLSLALAAAIAVGSAAVSGIPAPALSLGWYGDGHCDDAEAANPGAPGPCAYAAESSCANGVDDDSDERTDCLDPDCPACGVTTPCARTERDADGDCAADYYFWGYACGDGNDNEGDGQADCADADCAGDASCQGGGCEWWDFNCRTVPVCGDYRCEGGESCSSCSIDCGACGGTEICNDSTDNDGDGSIDCQDLDCATLPICLGGVEDCANNIDDDSDGSTDCGDTDCAPDARCQPETSCADATDNDSDGKTDCGDTDCASNPACDTGCADPCDIAGGCYSLCECNPADPICMGGVEVCDNSIDDDTDGDSDCADSDCADDPSCDSEDVCDDGLDNDADDSADCSDSDCSADPSCDFECTDPNACNYGNSGSCTYDCCPDENNDGLNDDTDESCGDGCSDPGAYNYDPTAPTGGNRAESCEYKGWQRFSISTSERFARGAQSWLAAAAAGSLEDLLAVDDPSTIQGVMAALNISLSRTEAGEIRFTAFVQWAPETASGDWPMGFIRSSPSCSFAGGKIVRTPPWIGDPEMRFIHDCIDRGFYGENAAKMHIILAQTQDVWHMLRPNEPIIFPPVYYPLP